MGTVSLRGSLPIRLQRKRDALRAELDAAYAAAGERPMRNLSLCLRYLTTEVRADELRAKRAAPDFGDRVVRRLWPWGVATVGLGLAGYAVAVTWSQLRMVGVVLGTLSALGMFAAGLVVMGAVYATIGVTELAATRDRAADATIAAELEQRFTPGVCKRAATILDAQARWIFAGKAVLGAFATIKTSQWWLDWFEHKALVSWQTAAVVALGLWLFFALDFTRTRRRAADIAAVAGA
jgi:hypothetical protein